MFGAETLDHVAFPVRDLPRSEKFYIETVGLTFLTQRKNADGSPRHTYVKAGENIIGLNLPGIQADAVSQRRAALRGRALGSETSFSTQRSSEFKQSGVSCGDVREHGSDSPFIRSFRFIDFDNNHFEICMNRRVSGDITFQPCRLRNHGSGKGANKFYAEALGLKFVGEVRR